MYLRGQLTKNKLAAYETWLQGRGLKDVKSVEDSVR